MPTRREEALTCLHKALLIIDAEGLCVASCHVQHAIDLVGEQQMRALRRGSLRPDTEMDAVPLPRRARS